MSCCTLHIHERRFLWCLLFILVSVGASAAYYSGHHYQHQQRHLSTSRRHQMNHRPSPAPHGSPVRAMHSSRFPNLDQFLRKLDSDGAGRSEGFFGPSTQAPREVSLVRPTGPPTAHAAARHSPQMMTPRSSAHRFEDLYEYEDDEEEDDEEDEDAAMESKVSWDVKWSEDTDYQRQQPAGGSGVEIAGGKSYSDRKWQVLGNRHNLDELRRRRLGIGRPSSSETEIQEAVQHALKVSREGSCKVPHPKVVSVKDVYPHPAKTYIPHCTILHQCGDDTGCCRHETLTCVARSSHRVELYFYTTTLGSTLGNTVEKLIFYNHTDCECQDKTEDMMPRDTGKSEVAARHFRHSSNGGGRPDAFGMTTVKSSYRPDRNQPPTQSCRCPSAYSVRYSSGRGSGPCTCDCFDKQRECIRAKRGKEYFSLQDRLCIQSDECLPPSCEFGIYLRRAGRCPRKREKFDAWQRYTMDEYK